MEQKVFTTNLKPCWFMRLLGAESAVLYLQNNGLRLKFTDGNDYAVLVSPLTEKATLSNGLLFARLILKTDDGNKVFSGLRKQDAKALFLYLRAYWLSRLTPLIVRDAQQIHSLLGNSYPRQSYINQALKLARDAVLKFETVPEPSWCKSVEIEPFSYVAEIAAWSKADISALHDRYVKTQLNAFADYFDHVESKPLTMRQREACVVDETNNLVLAGAGTGKTSTMISRAGYLLKSGQAKAEEILMLAFANKAANEMQERVTRCLGDTGITASTFHKLGKDIIAAVEGKQPSLSPLAEDEKLLAWQVNQWFEEHLSQPGYRKLTLHYFQHYLYPAKNPFDFDSEGAYFDYILANDIRTLKGEMVKSLGECLVANYLFRQGIQYQYEAEYQHQTASLMFRQYRPDFYLPDMDIYIEYFGIDRNGNTAPYIDRQTYHDSMNWKRQLHAAKNTRLIELFHYQNTEGTLFEAIDNQLAQLDVSYQPLASDTILDSLRNFGAINNFSRLLVDLLKRYRANCYEPSQIDIAINNADNPEQVVAALTLLQPILADYQELLDQSGHIDFDDMIGKAIAYVRQGRFRSHWRYILVDEFQDISDARARLVKYLRDSVSGCSLFCVGDDWQAIYRFAGSDLHFTTTFQTQFGATRVTALDLTFRFNNSISDIASRFVLQNPAQVTKTLNTTVSVNQPAVSLIRADNCDDRLMRVLLRIAGIAKPGSSVYLLGRYSFNLPDRSELAALRQQFPQLSLASHTIHASKGKEADYVVILGMESGKNGFPSEKITHPLLDALLPQQENFAHAEERRLFYVALTRARHRVYLITDMAVASAFVIELLNDKYPIELNEFHTSLIQQWFQMMKCTRCKTGTMVARQGPHSRFYGCNKFPLCTHTEHGCSVCGSPMRKAGRFKICLNNECLSWVPVCPEPGCGADMTRRKGRYGEFWGCRNYRSEGNGCKHTENVIQFDEHLLET